MSIYIEQVSNTDILSSSIPTVIPILDPVNTDAASINLFNETINRGPI